MDAPDASGAESLTPQITIESWLRCLRSVLSVRYPRFRGGCGSRSGCGIRPRCCCSICFDSQGTSGCTTGLLCSCFPSAYRRLLLANEQYHRKREIATDMNRIFKLVNVHGLQTIYSFFWEFNARICIKGFRIYKPVLCVFIIK